MDYKELAIIVKEKLESSLGTNGVIILDHEVQFLIDLVSQYLEDIAEDDDGPI